MAGRFKAPPRDTIIMAVALALAVWEILHEARPVVLTFLGALLTGPLVIRADEGRRNGEGP